MRNKELKKICSGKLEIKEFLPKSQRPRIIIIIKTVQREIVCVGVWVSGSSGLVLKKTKTNCESFVRKKR